MMVSSGQVVPEEVLMGTKSQEVWDRERGGGGGVAHYSSSATLHQNDSACIVKYGQ